MRRLALLLSVALAFPAGVGFADPVEVALRPVARPLPVAPMRPMLRPERTVAPGQDIAVPAVVAETGAHVSVADRNAALFVDVVLPILEAEVGRTVVADAANASPPPLEARISTRSAPPLSERLLHVEAMMDRMLAPVGDGPSSSEPLAVALRLPPTAVWDGLRPVTRGIEATSPGIGLRPELRPEPQPVAMGLTVPALVNPVTETETVANVRAGSRPALRSDAFEARIAERLADTVLLGAVPPQVVAELSPLAVGEALRPPGRRADFAVIAAAATVSPPAAAPSSGSPPALTSGSGLCGVPILTGRALGNVNGSGACGVENAVEVTAIGGIRLSNGLTVDCQTATALATWVRDVANPAVGNTGGGLSRIEVGGGYACRGRNNQANARLSEHAYGRAVDIMGFRLNDGTRLMVLGNWGNSILRQMHRGACGIFGTVLGPDANAFHRDHFHFDTARYRSGSYCR